MPVKQDTCFVISINLFVRIVIEGGFEPYIDIICGKNDKING